MNAHPHTPATEPTPPAELTLGFTRGVSPSKWVKRWQVASPEQPLTIVPIAQPYGRPSNAGDFDVVLERSMPGELPVGAAGAASAADASGDAAPAPDRTHHALKLYDEALAFVVPKEHDLAAEEFVSLAELAARADVRVLDHPHHAPGWPAAEAWEDPSWAPQSLTAALELVATGLGGIFIPAPLARHTVDKHAHAVVRISDAVVGGSIWASWPVTRDAPDVQHLAGVLRGRTARSSRSGDHTSATADAAQRAPKRQQPQKAKPKLKANSRGAQLQAAQEKREREKAERRKAKRK